MSLTNAQRSAENKQRRIFAVNAITQAAQEAGLLGGSKIYRRDEWDVLTAAIESGAFKVVIVPAKTGEEVE